MISAIRLVGCQSWEDCTITFAKDRINIIQALNNVGKSVIIKILKISVSPNFFSAKKRKKLIRWGMDEAKAIYQFTDGCLAAVIIRPTKVMYLFNDGKESGWVASEQPSQRMIDELGLLVNSTGSFIANIIDTDQNLLLVDSDSASTYEFIQMLCNNAAIDEYLSKLREIQKWITNNTGLIDFKLNKVNTSIEQLKYTDVDAMETKLQKLTTVKKLLYEYIDAAHSLERLSAYVKENRDFDKLLSAANTLQRLEQLRFSKLKVLRCPPDIGKIALLEKFESIHFEWIRNTQKPVSVAPCDLLGKLEYIHFTDVCVRPKPPEDCNIIILEKCELLLRSINYYCTKCTSAQCAKSSMGNFEQQFRSAGAEYECQIYGKVIFDGKDCVPYNY